MAFNITRMTLYALVSALEEDLRDILKAYVEVSEADTLIINKGLIEKAKIRIEKDVGVLFGDLSVNDYVDYLDIGDTFSTINSNSSHFPSHIAKSIKRFTKMFETVVPIRNRVMHIRPLNYDDLSIVTSLCELLVSSDDSLWKNIQATTKQLKEDPSYVLGLDIHSYDDLNSVNNNLPIPDFDETGLIGRDEIVEQVKALCLGGFPVISIVGEGGIGKTALALKVAYELLEDSKSPFDAIVWVTSKTTQITANEIKEIKGAISDSLGVIHEITTQVTGDITETSDLTETIEYLSTFRIALFIDNLETILDDNIRGFVGSLPNGSKIIITSRIGLGAYEYPIKLGGIDESYASQLLRTLAKIRKIDSLAKLDEKIIR